MHLLIYRLICISVETLTSTTTKKRKESNEIKKKVQSCRFIFDENNRLRRDFVRVIQREKERSKHVDIVKLGIKFVLIEIPE
jgi:hypothetical protein